MWETGYQEIMMGNQLAVLIVDRCWEQIERRAGEMALVAGDEGSVAGRALRYVRIRKREWRV